MVSGHAVRRSWQHWVEVDFERWGYFIYRNRWSSIATSLLVTAWLISYLPSLTIDNSTNSFLLPDDPAVVVYDDFREQFGTRPVIELSPSGLKTSP